MGTLRHKLLAGCARKHVFGIVRPEKEICIESQVQMSQRGSLLTCCARSTSTGFKGTWLIVWRATRVSFFANGTTAVSDLRADIERMNAFLTSQRFNLAADAWAAVSDRQAAALVGRMEKASLGAGEAAIAESVRLGPWTEAQKGLLAQAVADSLSGCKSRGSRRQNQSLLTGFDAYLSVNDKSKLSDSEEHLYTRLKVLTDAALSSHYICHQKKPLPI